MWGLWGKRTGLVLTLAALGIGHASAQEGPKATTNILEKAIIVTRHGVRPPTDQKKLDPLSVQAWPTWPVPDGDLTPHGAAAVRLMGEWYRGLFVSSGLLEQSGCPASGEVFAWADKAERTRATAAAILDGLYPGCGVTAGFDSKNAGALFHPVTSGVAPLDVAQAESGMRRALGGSIETGRARSTGAFTALLNVLDGPTEKVCAKAGLATSCRLTDLPWNIDAVRKGNSVNIKGPLELASTLGETFRLEYAQGFPLESVGWGRVRGPSDVKALLVPHKLYYDATLRVPYIARRAASQLLNQVSLSLQQGAGGSVAGGPPEAKVVLFAGHDTNIAPMQAAMGVSWSLPDYPENDTPPGGAFLFERWRDAKTGERSVRLRYVAQGLDQIRNLTPLAGGVGPQSAVLTLPACTAQDERGSCTLADFIKALDSGIDKTALAPVFYPGQ